MAVEMVSGCTGICDNAFISEHRSNRIRPHGIAPSHLLMLTQGAVLRATLVLPFFQDGACCWRRAVYAVRPCRVGWGWPDYRVAAAARELQSP